jgi:hypothetical protein
MGALSRNVLLYGSEEDLPKPVPLRAGPLSLLFEHGDLRYIRLGDREIVRRVYVAVRDHNWGTIAMRITNLTIDAGRESFAIAYDADHVEGNINFHWKATIIGTAEGEVRFAMQGEVRSTFRRNRIGFCVLHPPDCAAMPCRIVQENGTVIEKPFPRYIAPAPKEDPFVEIREMSYEFAPGRFADLHFDGDIFETEDQRNWSDGSYKTFCTPLRLPFPVEVKAGTKIAQHVRLQLRGGVEGVRAQSEFADRPIEIQIDAATRGRLPVIGIGATPERLTSNQIERLKALRPDHLRVDLRLSDSTAREALTLAGEQAVAIGAKLECALYCSLNAAAELRALLSWLKTSDPVGRWLIFDEKAKTTPPHLIQLAREILGPVIPGVAIGGGSNAYFTELNRDRPDLNAADIVCYSLNPQVHAFDNTSLVENALAIAATVESTRHIYPDKPIAVTPITLKPRFNPDATGAAAEDQSDQLPVNVDPRQMSLFGAAWTLAAVQSLAESGASSATFYETLGWRGVIQRDEGSQLPALFRSLPAGVFPLYFVLAAIGELQGADVITTRTSQPLTAAGLVLKRSGRRRVLLANLTPSSQEIELHGLDGEFRLRQLHETNVERAMQAPEEFVAFRGDAMSASGGRLSISLPPYAIVLLDSQA